MLMGKQRNSPLDETSRREFLRHLTGVGMVTMLPAAGYARGPEAAAGSRLPICIFSKHLQWLDWEPMAETAAKLGFDGVDLTVRKGGHVVPERVEEDLPKAAAAIRKAGLAFPMVTTEITDTGTPHAESILKTVSALGIPHYRWGGLRYTESKPLPEQLDALQPRVAQLEAMNKKYGLCAMYHTHSGLNEIGASMWDLWILVKDRDTRWISVNYDVAHAMIEGGMGGWVHSSRLLLPYTRGIAIKDFYWAKNAQGKWEHVWCPLGDGMVDLKRFLAMLKHAGFTGPVQMHFEYPLGGAEHGETTLSIDKTKVLAAMRRDLEKLRTLLQEAGLG
jgi:sugar phosphate isomerase/epimerase